MVKKHQRVPVQVDCPTISPVLSASYGPAVSSASLLEGGIMDIIRYKDTGRTVMVAPSQV